MAIALRTPLCRLLGIELPILSVGFGTGARAELAAVVSSAGGFGVLGRVACHRTRCVPRSPARAT